ncbi:hypothetical protein [Micromonospora costi]|uniref:Uncharacterized protein n=1 Tax=Micromonospora costi TaxID=1530042 RepID=A0A3B0A681_9ACTN|nr:hypothetical protein [Micromonospora costi]RKN55913.1 hypothetical protein D7193_15085 [Micromonospora costi]
MTSLDPRVIAADIMCGNARSITPGEVWAHIGQAYDTAEIDATLADEVVELIRTAGIDLLWHDGSSNTELDAARVEIERLTAELDRARQVVEAAQAWSAPYRTVLEFGDRCERLAAAVKAHASEQVPA